MNKKPSVLMLAQLPPPVHGASVMNKAIADSAAVRAAFDVEAVNISTAEAISDIGKGSLRKYLKFLGLLWRVFRAMSGRKHDLVYLTLSPHGAAFVKDALFALMAKAFGRKRVYHLHGKGIAAEYAKGGWKTKLYRAVFEGASVIHLAPVLYQDIEALVPRTRVQFLGNGVPSQASATEKSALPRIVYLSNMVPTKGARVLLEAAKLLRDRGLAFSVAFAGNWGTDPQFKIDFLEYLEREKLTDRVAYLGPQYGEDKKKLLNGADVFVLPTYFRNECFPLAILEAMSCGLAIVSTFEGAIPDMVTDGQTGLLVHQQSVTELADALDTLISDPVLRQKLADNALGLYREKYTLEAFEQGYIDCLNRVLEDRV
ncbi:MAG: glycosyltransferase family 4 protein [Gammaproteobacteria bacterium]|nr:glycosyltransferase family 4 protein [Gammaproteobacteria bacterium]